ncbi:MerR family transcriptional regulator [Egibacter rhizosphaerae]|uniref:transcriptional regulator FtsR n=1 Tax=Egibacter rhizosphaerae TaxID=1670831 RepID=UPI00197AE0C3|nr:MerR family transcriptional regulator [Egibacter rhizosphaerae]
MADGYTIGEVLNQLKEDFEDITISKIRFLESEGLIYPDRTDSGYRKFIDDDVDRLRFILTAQRDHYLPLKVIREQLDRLDAGEVPGQEAAEGGSGYPMPQSSGPQALVGSVPSDGVGGATAGADAGAVPSGGLDEQPTPAPMGVRELCEASGLEPGEVKALREFGVLGTGDDGWFDGEDVVAARAAKELLRLGLEPRHLRMYRQFVEREQALFEQLVTPLLRQRNPEARRQATRQLEQLSQLTGSLKSALLSRALRNRVHGSPERP